MKIQGIIWLDDIIEKIIKKHNVKQNEIIEVLKNKPLFRYIEKGHRPGENLYASLGYTNSDRKLIIFFIYKKNKQILVLTARDMTQNERKRYEQK